MKSILTASALILTASLGFSSVAHAGGVGPKKVDFASGVRGLGPITKATTTWVSPGGWTATVRAEMKGGSVSQYHALKYAGGWGVIAPDSKTFSPDANGKIQLEDTRFLRPYGNSSFPRALKATLTESGNLRITSGPHAGSVAVLNPRTGSVERFIAAPTAK